MSNLSNIGFPVKSEEDVNQMLMDVLSGIEQVACPPFGYYYRFEDPSGAQIFLQANPVQELMGFNPGFKGLATAKVELIRAVERDTSELDGAYVARAVKGGSAFVFDLPDFKRVKFPSLPAEVEVELTAFASSDLEVAAGGDNEEVRAVLEPLRVSEKDLLAGDPESPPPQAHVRIEAELRSSEERTNSKTGERFFVFGAETPTGAVSIVADPALLSDEPKKGDRLKGSFWLSGKISRI